MSDKMKVLIVDDDVGMCETLADILSDRGFSVEYVNDGLSAIEKVRKSDYDCLLMDINIPVMDGVSIFRVVKEIKPGIPVVMMTGYSLDDLIQEAIQEGAHAVLRKPIKTEEIVSTIKAAKEGALVLVVDDDPNTLESLKDILHHNGYVVATASRGEEAVEIVKRQPQQIVILDMRLPTMNGLETYQQLKKINPNVVAILMTAYQKEFHEMIDAALKKDSFTCLYKPFDPSQVTKLVEEIARKSHGKAARTG